METASSSDAGLSSAEISLDGGQGDVVGACFGVLCRRDSFVDRFRGIADRLGYRLLRIQPNDNPPRALGEDDGLAVLIVDAYESPEQAAIWIDAVANLPALRLATKAIVCTPEAVDFFGGRFPAEEKLDFLLPPLLDLPLERRFVAYAEIHRGRNSVARSKLHFGFAENVMTRMISSRRRSEVELKKFKHVVDSALGTVLMFEPRELRFVYSNKGAEATFGYSEDAWRSLHIGDVVCGMDPVELQEILKPLLAGEMASVTFDTELRHCDGGDIPVSVFVQFIGGASDEGLFITFVTDMSNQREQTALLQHQSLHDALTELPNRMLFVDRLRQAVVSARRNGHHLGLMMMDLDRFKEVNDSLGHQVGDLLLQQIAAKIRDTLRESDTVARMGGDEFAVLVPSVSGLADLTQVAQKIVQALQEPYLLEGHRLEVGISIGVIIFPAHGSDETTLMRRADVAMYVAKRNRESIAVYDWEQDRDKLLLLTLESDLRVAVCGDQLELFYQPKVDIRSGEFRGVEALVRWHHPSKGMIPPDAFIGVAERTGLIHDLTRRVIELALRQCRQWNTQGCPRTIAVNLSARNLQDRELVPFIKEQLAVYGISSDQLSFELTESDVMSDMDQVLKMMHELHDLGIRFAVDDFGTGYSSLAYLKRLPVTDLKIDKSFILNMVNNGDDLVIVHSTINMAHHLGLKVVAEGVENREVWDLLKVLECDIAQGYYLSPPMPATKLPTWVDEGIFHVDSVPRVKTEIG